MAGRRNNNVRSFVHIPNTSCIVAGQLRHVDVVLQVAGYARRFRKGFQCFIGVAILQKRFLRLQKPIPDDLNQHEHYYRKNQNQFDP